MITFPIKIVIKFKKPANEANKKENINKILSFVHDQDLLPKSINIRIYSKAGLFKIQELTSEIKITLGSLLLRIEENNLEKDKLLEKIIAKFEKFSKLDFTEYWFEGSENFLIHFQEMKFNAFKFALKLKSKNPTQVIFEFDKVLEGNINERVLEIYKPSDLGLIEKNLGLLGMGPFDSDKNILEKLPSSLRPNFIFIRSLLDFINSAPSESFSKAFLGIAINYPYLFEPEHKFWEDLIKNDENIQIKILFPLLNQTRGLTRVKFDYFVKYWKNMIFFLKKNCSSSASNFLSYCCETLELDQRDPLLIENIQLLLENNEIIKKYLGINFPYSLKAGRLLFTMITANRRGFNLIESTAEQIKEFNLPVDSQILRVALNTGLIEIIFCKTQLKDIGGKEAQIIVLKRSDMTEIVQKAWKAVSKKLDICPMELDYIIFSIGALVCNRFGKSCYCCPFTKYCKSWEKKKIFEGSGVEWNIAGGFSYAKSGKDALIFRTSGDDESKNPNNLSDSFYEIDCFSDTEEKIDLEQIINQYKEGK